MFPHAKEWLLLVLLLLVSACRTSVRVTGNTDAESLGTQSETAATATFSGGVHRIVVAYNDETNSQSTIQYGPTTRKVLRGASLLGWSYSQDDGATWTYGGKLTPPPGWAVLWGDPGLTTSRRSYGTVFLSNLAFPDAKFPAGGVDGGVDGSVSGGACLFRSSDGGVSFKFFQCISDPTPIPGLTSPSKGHFFDGASLAAGPGGEIYASYVDVDTSQIVVYRSPDGLQPFAPIPPPFPGFYIASHPRLQVGPDGVLFAMAIAKQTSGPDPFYMLTANRFVQGSWGQATLITQALAYPDVDFGSSLLGSRLLVRTGPQFSFDVGARSDFDDDSVRFLVTQKNSAGWLFVRGGACDYGLTNCGWYAGWTFGADTPRGQEAQRIDVFDPDVVAFPGFLFSAAPRWQGSFFTRFGNASSTLNLTRATLGYSDGQATSLPIDIAQNQPICPDQRGYLGDYDAHLVVHVENNSVRFTRFMPDSTKGCVERWTYTGQREHIQAVSYDN